MNATDRREILAVLRRSAEAGRDYLERHRGEWRERYGAEREAVIERFERYVDSDAMRVEEEMASDAATDGARVQAELAELSRHWIAADATSCSRSATPGHLNEEVMRELLFALDAEELALDSRAAVRADARGEAGDERRR